MPGSGKEKRCQVTVRLCSDKARTGMVRCRTMLSWGALANRALCDPGERRANHNFCCPCPQCQTFGKDSWSQNISSSPSQPWVNELHSSVEPKVDSGIVNSKRWNYELFKSHSDSFSPSINIATNQYFQSDFKCSSVRWGRAALGTQSSALCRAQTQPCQTARLTGTGSKQVEINQSVPP